MSRLMLLVVVAGLPTIPAAAQTMAPGQMPGMARPGTSAPSTPMPPAQPSPATAPQTPASPPAWTGDYAADRDYDPAAMAQARAMARMDMGGMRFSGAVLDLFEYQAGAAGGGYRWEGQAWYGGDYNRLVLRSEGEGGARRGLQTGEVQALYSHALTPYFDLQAGVRQDFAPLGRSYFTLGAQGLLPYRFNLDGALFLSPQGELLARAEGSYDLRLARRLVLQPRVELNFAAQNTPQTRTGQGLSNAEVGLRLRYEIRHEFAPYVGVSWDRRVGRSATYARAAGEDAGGALGVVGIMALF